MKRKITLLILLILCLYSYCPIIEEEKTLKQENNILIEEYQKEEKKNQESKEGYLGILEIPKINLKQGFFSFKNSKNTVEQGLEVINKDCLPFSNCNFILASHSGTASISHFKNLEKLEKNDIAYLYYKEEKKEYILEEINYQEKNGHISLKKTTEPKLVLTTCNKEKNNIQNIYILKEKK